MRNYVANEIAAGGGVNPGDPIYGFTGTGGGGKPNVITLESAMELGALRRGSKTSFISGGTWELPAEWYVAPFLNTALGAILANLYQTSPVEIRKEAVSVSLEGGVLKSIGGELGELKAGDAFRIYGGAMEGIYRVTGNPTANDVPVKPVTGSTVDVAPAVAVNLYTQVQRDGREKSTIYYMGEYDGLEGSGEKVHLFGLKLASGQFRYKGDEFVTVTFSGSAMRYREDNIALTANLVASDYLISQVARQGLTTFHVQSSDGAISYRTYELGMTIENGSGLEDPDGDGDRGVRLGPFGVNGTFRGAYHTGLRDSFVIQSILDSYFFDENAAGDVLLTNLSGIRLSDYSTDDKTETGQTEVSFNWDVPDTGGWSIAAAYLPAAFPAP